MRYQGKKVFKLIALAFLVFTALFFGFGKHYFGETQYSAELISSENECFYIKRENGGVNVTRIYPSDKSVFLPIDEETVQIRPTTDCIYAICSDSQGKITIRKFDYSANILDVLIIEATIFNSNSIRVADGDLVYFIPADNPRELLCIDFCGNILFRTELSQAINCIFLNDDGNIVASSDRSVFVIDTNGSKAQYNIAKSKLPTAYIGSNYFAASNGTILEIRQKPEKVVQTASTDFLSGGVSRDYICTNDKNSMRIIHRGGSKTLKYNFDYRVKSICAAKNTIFILTADNVIHRIEEYEIDELFRAEADNSGGTISDPDNTTNEYYINSSTYFIDTENFLILRTAPDTSVTSFVNNINHNFSDLILLKSNGELYMSGNVYTGLTARFSTQDDVADFTIIVAGDLNSNGKCNRKDQRLLVSHLLSKKLLRGNSLTAADINFDGKVSLADLLCLRLKNGR